MLNRSFFILCLILSLTHCASIDHKNTPDLSQAQHANPTQLSEPFSRVVINGNIDVTLSTGNRKHLVLLKGDKRDLAGVQMYIHHGLLYINASKGYPHYGPIKAIINTHLLTSLTYHGTGTITANHLHSNRLDLAIHNGGKTIINGKIALRRLIIAGSGYSQISGITGSSCKIKLSGKPHVRLAGILNVTNLTLTDNSSISLYWIKSHVLKIRAKDKAFIQLAGVADTLDAELKNNARLNGRYLRGSHVFIKTFDHSVADITTTKTQHTLASGASNIYVHNLPTMKADFMALNGSILDMRELDSAELKEPTRYNR